MAQPPTRAPRQRFPCLSGGYSSGAGEHGRLMTERDLEEYKALSATIRQRGTARAWVFGAGLAAWAALALATTARLAPTDHRHSSPCARGHFRGGLRTARRGGAHRPLPPGVLTRTGGSRQRWPLARRWPAPAPTRCSPSSSAWRRCAISCRCCCPSRCRVELAVIGGVHVLFIARLVVARHAAGRQRAADLARFQQMKNTEHEKPSWPSSLRGLPMLFLGEGNRQQQRALGAAP